jgi:hypothetical protein
LLIKLYDEYKQTRDAYKARDLYRFFENASLKGNRELRLQCQKHCEAMQAAIAERYEREQNDDQNIASFFANVPSALKKIDPQRIESQFSAELYRHQGEILRIPDIFRESIAPREQSQEGELVSLIENAAKSFSGPEASLAVFIQVLASVGPAFHTQSDIPRAAKVVAGLYGTSANERLDRFFRSFNIIARVITKRQSTNTDDLVMTVWPDHGAYLWLEVNASRFAQAFQKGGDFTDVKHRSKERLSLMPMPFSLGWQMLVTQGNKRDNCINVIPRLIDVIHDLAVRPAPAFLAIEIAKLEETLGELVSRSDDRFIRKAYKRHYPVALTS